MNDLTKKLTDSIAYERRTRQPFNPSLDEFSEDQLKLIARILSKEHLELRAHVRGLSDPFLLGMMNDKIIECESELEMINGLFIQFVGALKNKERERLADN